MAIADQENNSTLGRVVSGSVEAVNPKVVRPASPASKGNDNCRIEEFKDDHSDSMEYAWLEPRGHDPIATDTNLAEIDFENFRNELLRNLYQLQPFRYLKRHHVSHENIFRVI